MIESILTNEKYKGDARLQKKFTTDFLTKKMKVNEGEVPQYYVTDSHPAIIDPAEWDEVQKVFRRRKASKSRFSGNCFSGKIIWKCNAKFKDKEKRCSTLHLTEEQLKDAYRQALSLLVVDREQLVEDGRLLKSALADTTGIEKKMLEASQEMEVLAGLIKQCIEDNAATALDQDEYNQRYNGLVERYEAQKTRLEALQQEKDEREFKEDVLSGFLFEIIELEDMDTEFNDVRFEKTVDHITVYNDGRLVFTFFVGKEITVEI